MRKFWKRKKGVSTEGLGTVRGELQEIVRLSSVSTTSKRVIVARLAEIRGRAIDALDVLPDARGAR